MYIKHYRGTVQRVPHPLHPNHTVPLKGFVPSGSESLSHEGKTYKADAHGWFNVPEDLGVHLCKFRQADGGGFLQVGAVPTDPEGSPVPEVAARSTRTRSDA